MINPGFLRLMHVREPVLRSKSPMGTRQWWLWLTLGAFCVGSWPAHSEEPAHTEGPKPKKELFRGEVVLIPAALKQLGVKAYPEELKDQVGLLTPENELLPILPDWRGRAFFQDERLRNRKVELIGYRKPGVPYLQVLSVYTFDEAGARQFTDYWCDICSIPMYEIKPCDCCQQPIRLRFQPRELPADVVKPDVGK